MPESSPVRHARSESIVSIQRWMYGAITSEERPAEADVLERLTESERIDIYRGMYEIRVLEALEADYPAVAAFAGAHLFAHLAHDYAIVYPSRSYTMNRLGDHFPSFVRESAVEHGRFLHDLARLELAMTEVFDEVEVPPISHDAIGAITPDSRLRLIPALRLLDLAYPVNEAFQAWRDEDPLVVPEPRRTWLAVHRRDYSVMRMPLDGQGLAFLEELAAGATLGEACERLLPTQEQLFAWFRDWSAAGLIGAVE